MSWRCGDEGAIVIAQKKSFAMKDFGFSGSRRWVGVSVVFSTFRPCRAIAAILAPSRPR
jgi:hypothetical protein